MRLLLIGLLCLIMLSALVVACEDTDSDKVKELEQRIEALENGLGTSSPSIDRPSGDYDFVYSFIDEADWEEDGWEDDGWEKDFCDEADWEEDGWEDDFWDEDDWEEGFWEEDDWGNNTH